MLKADLKIVFMFGLFSETRKYEEGIASNRKKVKLR